jgi:alkylation response protein AidB-like acyl-CoA dehydrogenase
MASENAHHVTEKESLRVAEAARQTEWEQPSFMRELFLGTFRKDLVYPYPLPAQDRAEFTAFFGKLEAFLRDEVDAAEIDRSGEYPQHVLDGLRRLGAFGIKIPKEYGGLGMSHVEYGRVMTLLGSRCGNVASLLSAHQSIGVPAPLINFGTEQLKR